MYMYLVRESADISGEFRVGRKLTDVIHKKLHHFEMTLHIRTDKQREINTAQNLSSQDTIYGLSFLAF